MYFLFRFSNSLHAHSEPITELRTLWSSTISISLLLISFWAWLMFSVFELMVHFVSVYPNAEKHTNAERHKCWFVHKTFMFICIHRSILRLMIRLLQYRWGVRLDACPVESSDTRCKALGVHCFFLHWRFLLRCSRQCDIVRSAIG